MSERPRSLAITSTGRVGLSFCEHPKAQLAVVLILKRPKRGGQGLKSHLTDWEKPGIEPETPGLQGIDLSPSPRWTTNYRLALLILGENKAVLSHMRPGI